MRAQYRNLCLDRLEVRRCLSADPMPFVDVNDFPVPEQIQEMARIGDTIYYVADGIRTGSELWKTDGTADGTTLVRDITPGLDYFSVSELTVVNETLYFVANDGVHGHEVWRSDGTEDGTWMVKDIRIENDDCLGEIQCWNRPADLTNVNGTLYFTAPEGQYTYGLWKTNGTEAGTERVLFTENSVAYHLESGDGVLYFTYDDDLWRADGATAEQVTSELNVKEIAFAGANLYLSARSSEYGPELWKSDGTEAGTTLVKDIREGSQGSLPRLMTSSSSGLVYFAANDGVHGLELWRSDGTEAGTFLLKDIRPGTGTSFIGGGHTFVDGGGTIYFYVNVGTQAIELWKTDGTEAGTTRLIDETFLVSEAFPRDLAAADGALYFVLSNHNIDADDQLWKSDGTSTGTSMLKEFSGRELGATNLNNLDGELYFSAADLQSGGEVWTSDGTSAGTVRVSTTPDTTRDARPHQATLIGDTLYFGARSGGGVDEALWSTDGTPEGTNFVSWLGDGSITSILPVADSVLVMVGDQLWKSDGTENGTSLVKDFAHTLSLVPAVSTGDQVFFRSVDALWTSDGTASGTVKIADNMLDDKLAVLNDSVVYTTDGGDLWITDGSATTLLGEFPRAAIEFVAKDGILYFVGYDEEGDGIWRTDGTPEGTYRLINSSSFYRHLTFVGDELYFMAHAPTPNQGFALWKTDTTSHSTSVVVDMGSQIQHFTVAGDTLIFLQGDALWKTDGTALGTQLLKEFSPFGRGYLTQTQYVDGWFYFVRVEPTENDQLWRSDGTAAGTTLVTDVFSSINTPILVNDELLSIADTASYGSELYSIERESNDLVAYWDFEGDESRDGAIVGQTTDQAAVEHAILEVGGIDARAILFDSDEGVMSIESSRDINIGTTSEKTIAFWFLPNDADAPGRQVIYEQGGTRRGMNIYLEDGKLFAGAWNTPNGWNGSWVSTNSFDPDGWNHVALTISSFEGELGLFVNSVLAGTAEAHVLNGHNAANLGAVKLGTRFAPGDTGFQAPGAQLPFRGYVDELRIYDDALRPDQIADLLVVQPVTPIGLLNQTAFWDFEGDAADRAVAGLYSDDGILDGVSIADRVGIGSSAVQFSGNSDVVRLETSPDINEGRFPQKTISMWYNLDDYDGTSRLVLYEQGGTVRGLNIYFENGYLYAGGWNDSSDWAGDWIETWAYSVRQWHHVALTYDSVANSMQLYWNGSLVGETQALPMVSHNPANIGGVRVGSRVSDGNGGYLTTTAPDAFDGYIDNVRIFGDALSSEEISFLYKSQRPVSSGAN